MNKEEFIESTRHIVEEFREDVTEATKDGVVTGCNNMIMCAIHEDETTYHAIANKLIEEFGALIVFATLKTVKKIHDDLQDCQSEEEYERIVIGYEKFKYQVDTLVMNKKEKKQKRRNIK